MSEINIRGDGFRLKLGVTGYESERRGESYDDNWLRGAAIPGLGFLTQTLTELRQVNAAYPFRRQSLRKR